MIKIICDRCRAEIAPGKIGYVSLGFREAPGGEIVTGNQFEDFHFCSNCIEKINAFVSRMEYFGRAADNSTRDAGGETTDDSKKDVRGVTADDPASADPLINLPQVSDPSKKPRRKIDIGKIMALREAGWSNAKIADEMGMSSAAVAQAVYAYRRKHERGDEV